MKQCQIEFSHGFAALENLDYSEDMRRAKENIKQYQNLS